MINTTLDKNTLEAIKKNLLEEKERITKELNLVARKENDGGEDEYKPTFPEYGDKPDENAQEMAEYEANLAEEDLLEHSLRDIEKALGNIENGTYGTCKYCHQPIDPRRLQARPTASSCIDCKTKLQNS
ncbi:MAG: TraR/DksA C4-type zinc finger protein [Patescibacteria group bacterium]|jgi:RNA polymerase-binding protein DksA